MMPGMDGLEVCRRIRAKSSVPVLMLTARGDETDRVVGLELGADDYLPKPFSPRELVARLRAVLRRARPDVGGEQLSASGLTIDVPSRRVSFRGAAVDLTGIEFDILVALVRRAGRVVPRDALLTEAGRGDVVVGERTVDVHISHLLRRRSVTILQHSSRPCVDGYALAKDDAMVATPAPLADSRRRRLGVTRRLRPMAPSDTTCVAGLGVACCSGSPRASPSLPLRWRW